jgi:hypothetical protein
MATAMAGAVRTLAAGPGKAMQSGLCALVALLFDVQNNYLQTITVPIVVSVGD